MNFRGRKHRKELAAAIARGRSLLVARQPQELFDFLEQAVQRFPDDAEIRLLYATALLEIRPEDVAPEAAKAVELGPDDPLILVRAGQLLIGKRQLETAQFCATRTRELTQPDFVLMSSLLNLEGHLAAFGREYDLAEKRFRSAVECEPANGSLASELAKFLRARGRRTEALAVIDRALELSSGKEDDLVRLRAKIAGESEVSPDPDTSNDG